MRPRALRLLFGFPLCLLALCFLIVCLRFRTAWPWSVVVHEDGQRTLLGTIFYFEHALGELPLDILLAVEIAGAALLFVRPVVRLPRLCAMAGAAALIVDGLIYAGTWASVGLSSATSWLLQYHTRPEAPLVFGSHWRYHFLSEIFLMLWSALLLAVVEPYWPRFSRNGYLWIASWVLLAIGCFVFGLDAAPFGNPLYLGHEARESFTHALVTVPLAIGLLVWSDPQPRGRRYFWPGIILIGAVCMMLMAYQAVGAVIAVLVGRQAQTRDLTKLICGHFFEHTFSYLVVPLHALWFFLLAGGVRWHKGRA